MAAAAARRLREVRCEQTASQRRLLSVNLNHAGPCQAGRSQCLHCDAWTPPSIRLPCAPHQNSPHRARHRPSSLRCWSLPATSCSGPFPPRKTLPSGDSIPATTSMSDRHPRSAAASSARDRQGSSGKADMRRPTPASGISAEHVAGLALCHTNNPKHPRQQAHPGDREQRVRQPDIRQATPGLPPPPLTTAACFCVLLPAAAASAHYCPPQLACDVSVDVDSVQQV